MNYRPTYDPMILSLGYCPFCRQEVTEADYTTELCEPCWRKAVAAPELLQNLKQVVACLEYAVNVLEAPEKSSIRENLALAKQAIAKAEG